MHQNKNTENSPLRKIRIGRFQISIWRFKKLLSNGEKESTAYIEQWIDVDRACIQYSTKNRVTGEWENQSIWCSAEELRCLASVVDQFNEIEDGDEESSPQTPDGFPRLCEVKTLEVRKMVSRKVHNTIEYLKQKAFFHDTFDLEDDDIGNVLATYGIHKQFTEKESEALANELHHLGEQNEFREAVLSTRKSEVVGGMQMLEVEV